MKHIITATLALMAGICMTACSGSQTQSEQKQDTIHVEADAPVAVKELAMNQDGFHHTYLVADQEDERHIYRQSVNRNQCFIVVSKKEYRLYVYEIAEGDTLLAASFPVCYAINPEAKEREGDNKTPECGMGNPFHIMEIKDASTWTFDFSDGRGQIEAFGHWFMRLDLSESFPDNPDLAANRSIGIHGSTGNEASIPGRDSHGCVRLYDDDLNMLYDKYAQVGTMVVIKGIEENKWPYELKAQEQLGDKYEAPRRGNTLLKQSTTAPAQEECVTDEEISVSDAPETSEAEGSRTRPAY